MPSTAVLPASDGHVTMSSIKLRDLCVGSGQASLCLINELLKHPYNSIQSPTRKRRNSDSSSNKYYMLPGQEHILLSKS